jgi:hypothetical protein
MAKKGWKNKKTPIIVGTETAPTKMESGQVIINKKATKQNLDRLIEINNDGLDKPIKKEVTTDGTEGGLLKGKPHYDKNGNSLGGIPAVVDGAKNIETEGEEFVINKEASQKHWKELSKINQSAGNGVPINPSDVGSDEDPQEFRKGGTAKIIFNPNHIPNKWIYSYAKKIKENYPKVWDMGGNIFGNEAFKNLERVVKRGYWTDNEEWMYIKWQSYVARHHKDFRIAGTVAMLKWVDKTDKGWDYMKALIDKEVAKKYPKKGFKRKLSEGGGVELSLHDKLAIERAEREVNNLSFNVLPKQKKAVIDFIVKGYYNFEQKNNTITAIGGKTYDLNKVIINPNGDFYIISKKETGGGVEFIPEKKGTLIRGNEIIKYFEKVNGNYRLMFYTLNETKLPTMCDAFGYCEELDIMNITPKELGELIKKNNLMEYGGMMEGQPPANFENVLYTELANRYEKGGLIAPNGKKSNLTTEQYRLVRTPEFKAWFGDWENSPKIASKVVDENGEPLIVYHFTDAEFTIFEINSSSKGFFFTENPKDDEFSTEGMIELLDKKKYPKWLKEYIEVTGLSKEEVKEKLFIESRYKKRKAFFLNIRKMYDSAEIGKIPAQQWSIPMFENEHINMGKIFGYNGVEFVRKTDNKRIIVAFESEQIKLADGTNTTFDGNNPDIRYELGGSTESHEDLERRIMKQQFGK